MKLVLFTIVVTMFTLSATSHAAGKSMLSRGGLGFLFPDHNSFNNPGQFSLDKGFGFEGSYDTQSSTVGSVAAAGASAVYSTGHFGLGAFGNRAGTSFSTTGTFVDTAGAGLGFAMAKERLTLGVSATKVMTTAFSTNDGVVGVGLTWNGSKREGFTLGAGVTTTLNDSVADKRSVTAGLGYGFKNGYSVEGDFNLPDMNATSAYTFSGYLNMTGKMFYFSGGGVYDATSAVATQSAKGRLGIVLGNTFDLSGTVTYPFQTGGNPTYGGTARLAF